MITATQLRERMAHERKGCRLSLFGLFDERCHWCKQVDVAIAEMTREGWAPTPADKAFLRRLRISPN